MYHGEADTMIKYSYAAITYKELKDKGFNIEVHIEEDLPHSVSIDELKKVSRFLHEHMPWKF